MMSIAKYLARPLRALLLAAPLAGASLPAGAAALQVFACEPEWGALASEIGGDRVQVYVATTPHQDPHHVEARPSLVAQLRKADLVACTGAGLEAGWLPPLLARGAGPQLRGERLFFAAEKVERLDAADGAVDRGKGDVHAGGNPHVHLDPRRMMQLGDALAATLGRVDPAHADAYRQRAQALRARIAAVIADPQTAALRGRSYLVYHDAWTYLFDWLGLQQAGTLEVLPGVPPSGRHLSKLVAQLASAPVAGIVHTGFDDAKAVAWIARHGNSCALELPYTVGGSAQATDLAAFYRDLVARLARGCR